jgi:flagellar hook-associated protein 3 FlgL
MINSDYSFMARLLSNSGTVRDQLEHAQEQVASGLVSDSYSGLGVQARTALSLAPAIAHQTAYGHNIDAAQGRLDVTQSSMTAISGIAAKFYAAVNTYNPNDSTSVQSLAADAKSALQQIGDLLNTKSGDIYVFAGQDTDNPPVPDTDPTVMSTGLLSSSSGPPFSSTIGTKATVQVGPGQTVQVGLIANTNTLATSAPPTTGSYMRDTLTALAKIAGLGTSTTGPADVASARVSLSGSISAMATETGSLGNIQSDLTARQSQLTSLTTSLSKQLSSAQNVDVAEAISRAALLQTQLQASYQIIAQSRSLSLASYL